MDKIVIKKIKNKKSKGIPKEVRREIINFIIQLFEDNKEVYITRQEIIKSYNFYFNKKINLDSYKYNAHISNGINNNIRPVLNTNGYEIISVQKKYYIYTNNKGEVIKYFKTMSEIGSNMELKYNSKIGGIQSD